MPFPPQPSNGLVGIWTNGQATIPPPTPPDFVTDSWTGKPKVALNEWQQDNMGRVFFFLTVAAEFGPLDVFADPNGIGSCFLINTPAGARYYNCIRTYPVSFENTVMYMQCLLVDVNDV